MLTWRSEAPGEKLRSYGRAQDWGFGRIFNRRKYSNSDQALLRASIGGLCRPAQALGPLKPAGGANTRFLQMFYRSSLNLLTYASSFQARVTGLTSVRKQPPASRTCFFFKVSNNKHERMIFREEDLQVSNTTHILVLS